MMLLQQGVSDIYDQRLSGICMNKAAVIDVGAGYNDCSAGLQRLQVFHL